MEQVPHRNQSSPWTGAPCVSSGQGLRPRPTRGISRDEPRHVDASTRAHRPTRMNMPAALLGWCTVPIGKLAVVLSIAVAPLLLRGPRQLQAPPKAIFFDDFSGPAPDRTRWNIVTTGET